MSLYEVVLSRLFPKREETRHKSYLAIRALQDALEDMRLERKRLKEERMRHLLDNPSGSSQDAN